MPEAAAPRDVLAEVMDGGKKAIVPHLAEMLRRKGIAEVPTAEQKRRFDQPAITDEQEQQMWQQEMIARGIQQLVPGDPATIDIGLKISKAKFPDRWDMMTGEGRDKTSAQAEWAWKMARSTLPKPKEQTGQATDAMDGGY